MSVTSTDSAAATEDDQQITFFTIKCGEIFHTPDRQFFLLNCGECGKGFCALNEFIDHVNHAPCGPLTASDVITLPAVECESVPDMPIVVNEQDLSSELDCIVVDKRKESVEDGDNFFQELIEYTNSEETDSAMDTYDENPDENYLLPELGCTLFEEVDVLKTSTNSLIENPFNNLSSDEAEAKRPTESGKDGRTRVDEIKPNDPFTTRLIDLYRTNECLWDKGHPDYHNRAERNEVYEQIVNSLQTDFHCTLTVQELNYKLNRLRYAYYRELRKMRTFQSNNNNPNEKFMSSLWYFEHLKFLKGNTGALLEVPTSKILFDIIDGLQRYQCLWDESHQDFKNRNVRYSAYDAIASTIEVKYSIRTTRRSVVLQIKKLQALYAQSLRSHGESNSENEDATSVRALLLKKLEFLKGKIRGCKEIKCDYCDEVFFSATKYKLHHQKHTGDLPFSCSKCNKQFLHKPSLKAHEDTHLDVKDRPFTCEFCGLKIADRTNYRVHVQRHKGELRHECKICKKRLGTTTELKNHMLDHTGERPFVCDQCGNQYKSKSELTRHTRLHAAQKDFKCGYCVKAFNFQSQLDQHMLMHFSQPCEICGEEINGRRAFIRHKKEHY